MNKLQLVQLAGQEVADLKPSFDYRSGIKSSRPLSHPRSAPRV
jgi:hypothetical protein